MEHIDGLKTNTQPNFGCVIMASGIGKRFGSNKLMANLAGRPLISWILDATENLFTQRIVVTRHPEIKSLCIQKNIPVILHNMPHRNDTVRIGLEAMSSDISGCMFCPCDQPLLSTNTLKTMLSTATDNPESILRTAYQNISGAPVLFPQWTFNELMNLPEKKGGNIILKKYPERIIYIPVQHYYELHDVDTPEDLHIITEYLSQINLI